MEFKSKNSFQSLDKLTVSGKKYNFFNLAKSEKNGLKNINKLPKSIKVLLENLLRFEDNITVNKKQIEAIAEWLKTKSSKQEIAYRPARILLQDYTGIPAVADLAAMRDAVKSKNKDQDNKNIVKETIHYMFIPCVYTSLTTIVAFASLVVSGIRPVIDFGHMMTLGITSAFIITIIVFTTILIILPNALPADVNKIIG